jgi:hypothetical protein
MRRRRKTAATLIRAEEKLGMPSLKGVCCDTYLVFFPNQTIATILEDLLGYDYSTCSSNIMFLPFMN